MEARQWTAQDVVMGILGTQAVAFNATSYAPGQVVLTEGVFPSFSCGSKPEPQAWMIELGIKPAARPPEIELDDLGASDGFSLAAAAHEASHAYLWLNHLDATYRDEGHTNALAGEWLRANIAGFKQHAALEAILVSNIHYGLN